MTCSSVTVCLSCSNTFYAEAAMCKSCAAGCSRCPGTASCTVCTSNCPAGSMFDYTVGVMMCKPCATKGCKTCEADVNTCEACMAGFTKGDDNSCTANATEAGAPCSSGYWRNSTGFCVQCNDGCAECTSNLGAGCVACNAGVPWT